MIIAELLQLERDEGGRFFLESRKKQRTCVVDGKAAGFKLGVALATPVAGESLNRPDESKLSSVRFLLSPLVWRSQTIGEIFKGTDGACADPGPRIFPATGAFTNSAFRFYSIDFYVTHRFFVTFFPEESNVPF